MCANNDTAWMFLYWGGLNYIGTFLYQIRISLIIIDFPKSHVIKSIPVGKNAISVRKISGYLGHHYLIWKSPNIVQITLVCNIFMQFIIDIHLLFSFKHFKIYFLIDNHYATQSDSSYNVRFVTVLGYSCKLWSL